MKESITIIWTWQDVKEARNSLTKEECCKVLEEMEKNYDTCDGINWEIIEFTILDLFGEEQVKAGDMFKFKVSWQTKPSPGSEFYQGYVKVYAENITEVMEKAKCKICNDMAFKNSSHILITEIVPELEV